MNNSFVVLIIEPNARLSTPYDYLPRSYTITRISSVNQCKQAIHDNPPQLVCMSASIGPTETVEVLEIIKTTITSFLPGIVIVVDLSTQLSFVVGTSWGGKLAVTDSHTSAQEFFSILSRVI